MCVVNDIVNFMEKIAPRHLAQEWDNSGLQCGDPQWPVNHVMVALDPSPRVLQTACEKKVDMLITHHPLIFRPFKNLLLDTPMGKMIDVSLRHRLAIFSAHTNLDSVRGGLNDLFAKKIGLRNLSLLDSKTEDSEAVAHGIGRIGELEQPIALFDFSRQLKSTFDLSMIKMAGSPSMKIKKAAVCTGSGSGLMKHFFETDADVYISGDLKFHDAKDADAHHRALIDVGHFASESLMIDFIVERLGAMIRESGSDIRVEALHDETDPFTYL